MEEKLVIGLDKASPDETVMICFPYAGGGASAYYRWDKSLEQVCRICPVQLPGREERMGEPAYARVEEAADHIAAILGRYSNPMVLFGHSMGTKLAYEVERRLEDRGKSAKLMIMSGCLPPHRPDLNPLADLPDDEFAEALAAFHGISEGILNNKELLKFFMPTLRADFTMSESYRCNDRRQLKAVLRVMGGKEDTEAPEEGLKEWKEYSSQEFAYQMFEGSHFYIKEREPEVLCKIEEWIKKYA